MSETIKKQENDLKDEIINIIRDYCNLSSEESVHLDTDLTVDLGCAGIDAYKLIEEICIKYEMHCKDFEPDDVFYPEYIDFARSILNPVFLMARFEEKEKTELPKFTVGMLIEAVKNKKLASVKPWYYFYAKEIITK